MFEYLFFWFYQYYKKVYKLDDSPIYIDTLLSMAAIGVCAIQFLCAYCIIMILGIVISHYIGFSFKYLSIPLIVACVSITIWGIKKKKYYREIINSLTERHESNPLNQKIKGWMMYLFMIGLFLLPVVFSYVYNLCII